MAAKPDPNAPKPGPSGAPSTPQPGGSAPNVQQEEATPGVNPQDGSPSKPGKSRRIGTRKTGAKKRGKKKGKGKGKRKTKKKGKAKGESKGKGKKKGKGKRKGKKKKEKQKRPRTTPRPPEVVQPAPASPKPIPLPQQLVARDQAVIFLLWCYEGLHTLVESFKSSFIQYKPTPTVTREVKFTLTSFIMVLLQLGIALAGIGIIAIVANGRPKIVLLVFGLTIYLLTPVFGLLVNRMTTVGFSEVLVMADVGWVWVSPIRYWLIFHQKFPLLIGQTRPSVTYNELFIFGAEYIAAVGVPLLKFSRREYHIAWIVVLLVCSIWLGSVIMVRQWMNQAKDEISVLEGVYQDYDMRDSFLARNTSKHRIWFTCLILPCMIMAMQAGTVSYIFGLMKDSPSIFVRFRLDLIIALICLPIISGFLLLVIVIRLDVDDLLVIALALFLNILLGAMFVVQITNAGGIQEEYKQLNTTNLDWLDERPQKIPPNVVLVQFFYPEGIYDELQVMPKEDDPFTLVLYANSVVIYATIDTVITLVGEFPDETTLTIAKNLKITQSAGYFFCEGELTQIKNFENYLRPAPTYDLTEIIYFSGHKPCAEGPRNDSNGARIQLIIGCTSFEITITIHTEESKFTVPIKIPLLGEEPTRVTKLPADASHMVIDYGFNGSKTKETTDAIPLSNAYHEKVLPYLLITTTPRGIDDVKIAFFEPIQFESNTTTFGSWPKSNINLVEAGLTASSIFTGLASASYLHFIWIQCPFQNRMLLLAAFVAFTYTGSTIPQLFLVKPDLRLFIYLLCVQVVGWIWHVIAMVFFYKQLRPLNEEEKKDHRQMKF